MSHAAENAWIACSKVQQCLVVSIQGKLYDSVLQQYQTAIPGKAKTEKAAGVVLDFNAVPVLDSHAVRIFYELTQALLLMGIPAVWVAVNPGVASSLIDLNVNLAGLQTARTLEDGLQALRGSRLQESPDSAENEPGDAQDSVTAPHNDE